MLNDLALIERLMRRDGIDLVDRHPDVKDMAKGEALRVRLDAQGRIDELDIVAQAGAGATWTLRDGQHNGFPGLKTRKGLLDIPKPDLAAHATIWKTATGAAQLAELQRLVATFPLDPAVGNWPEPGHRRRIAERAVSLAALADDPDAASVAAVGGRFLAALDRTPSFAQELAEKLVAYAANRGGAWVAMARSTLIEPVALLIDVAANEFARDAGDPRQIGPVSAALAATAGQGRAGRCALTGRDARLHEGNFPQPNLPGLGQTYLFSRNADIPSLTRYGQTSNASYSIDAALARRLAGAVSVLTDQERQGRTWRLIPAETGDKPDLLITSANLADALADDETPAALAQWEELGRQLQTQLDGAAGETGLLEDVIVLVLRTVDPANRKAIYQRRSTSRGIFDAWRVWRLACGNTPDWLMLRTPVKGERQLLARTPPKQLAPLSLTPMSAVLYANGGRRRIPLAGVAASEAFALFFGEGESRKRAGRVLRLLVQRHGALLAGLAQARAVGVDALKTFDPKADLRPAALRSAAWIGALLHRLGREKETYMSDVAFRLGQLLSVVDRIHVGYCADMRGGATPPVLIGAAVFGVAGDDPMRALAMLQQRIKPYLAWLGSGSMSRIRERADGLERKGERPRAIAMRAALSLPHRARELLEGLSGELRLEDARRAKNGDAFRAELLLGYLAGLKPAPKKTTDAAAGGAQDEGEDQE